MHRQEGAKFYQEPLEGQIACQRSLYNANFRALVQQNTLLDLPFFLEA